MTEEELEKERWIDDDYAVSVNTIVQGECILLCLSIFKMKMEKHLYLDWT